MQTGAVTHQDHPPPGEEDIRVEQTLLMLRSLAGTYLAGSLVTLVLTLGLWHEHNRGVVGTWCMVTLGLMLYMTLDARRRSARPMTPAQASLAMQMRIGLNAVHGCIWGCLPWIALSATSHGDNLMVLASLACLLAGSMALNAPTPQAFTAFAVPLLALVVSWLWWIDVAAYRMVAIGAVIYVASLALQSRVMLRSTRASIKLRFENLALVEKLRIESDRAKAAHAEAEQANAAKSGFLAATGHDLRQPVHAHGLFLEVLARTNLDAEQRCVLGHMQATARAVAGMLDTLLDFSRIEAGVIQPHRSDFRLQDLLNKVERELAPQADSSGLIYRSRDSALAVHSDPALVELIVRNLVSNAIRYTKKGGVLVAGRLRGAEAWIEVWDTGIGIAAVDQADVFREFYQVGNPERDRRKGLGLGLAICQGLARVLGQRLWLASRPDCGSVFRLALPLAQTQVASVAEPQASTGHDAPSIHARVLILDDDDQGRTGMAQLLHTWGCECMEADTIEAALALARQRSVDVLISDFRLREHRTGVQAIAAFKKAFTPAPAMLLVTGDTDPQRLRDAHSCGAVLLHKPVAPDALCRSLQACLVPKPETTEGVASHPPAGGVHKPVWTRQAVRSGWRSDS